MTTDAGEHEADVLVVALGADYDFDATPGLAEGGTSSTPSAGAERLRDVLPDVHERPRGRRRLRRAVQVPAGAERGGAAAARLPDGARRPRRLRDLARDAVRQPGSAVAGHLGGAARGVRRARHRVRSRPPRRLARPGTRRRRRSRTAPSCRTTSSSASRSTARPTSCSRAGWPRTATSRSTRARSRRGSRASTRSATSRPSACRRRACSPRARRASSRASLIAAEASADEYDGRGSCYIEFGAGRVGRVDVDFLSGPSPTGTFQEPSSDLVAEKKQFGASRRARWFGR